MPQSLIPTNFYEQPKRRGFYWLTPVVVLVLYLCVMGAFVWLQRLQHDSVMGGTVDQEVRQQRLMMVVAALSCVIVVSLLFLWRYARIRSRAEAALMAETRFRRAMEDSMSTGMRVLDMQGRIAYVNPAFCRLIGWDEADLVGRAPPFPYWVPGRYQRHRETLNQLLSGHAPNSGLEVEAQRSDGSRFTARMYVSPLRDLKGEQIGWMTSMTDITEPRRIREALSAAHERFMTVLEGLDDAISVVADTADDLELLFANRVYRSIFGAQAGGHGELFGTGQFDQSARVEVFSPSAQRWFEVQHRTLTWTDGRRVRMQVARDITERRRHEEASRVQQTKIQLTSRLTTMGEMASSLAHELNQPLTAISNYNMGAVAMIRSGRAQVSEVLGVMEKSAQQAERAGKIIHRIREFVKRSVPQRQAVAVARLLENAVEFAEIDARKRRVRIDCHLPDDIPEVMADPILIEQVLLNLIKNGVEAMEASDERTLHVRVTGEAQQVDIAVIDRGHGLKDPERLFEPFYSTKSEGLGMGLNICRTIIESHHGRLWAEANPAGGTIFRFTLPSVARAAVDAGERARSSST